MANLLREKLLCSIGSKQTHKTRNEGLTLIECLVAIVVIAITMAAVTPMMVFAVATRVQNQRTEQALQIAQAEIDKVRLVVDQGGDYGDRLKDLYLFEAIDPITSSPLEDDSTISFPAPVSFDDAATISAADSDEQAARARKIDVDGDGTDDFAIQMFRTQGITVLPETGSVVESTPVVFNIGVRVYDVRAEASADAGTLLASTADLTFTSGEGQRGNRPLAALYGQIAQGDRDGGLCQYWQFAGASVGDSPCE